MISYIYKSINGNVELHPIRLQNPITHKEQLRIDIKVDNKDSGTIYCDLLTLEEGLQQVRLYGTGIQRPEIIKIRKNLDDNYLDIETQKLSSKESMSDEIKALYNVFCIYISGNEEIYSSKDFYDIPVTEFKTLVEDSEYPNFSPKECKERLKLLNYIKCNNNRNDYTIREEKKTQKVIRFIKKDVDEQLRVIAEEQVKQEENKE